MKYLIASFSFVFLSSAAIAGTRYVEYCAETSEVMGIAGPRHFTVSELKSKLLGSDAKGFPNRHSNSDIFSAADRLEPGVKSLEMRHHDTLSLGSYGMFVSEPYAESDLKKDDPISRMCVVLGMGGIGWNLNGENAKNGQVLFSKLYMANQSALKYGRDREQK